jgi:excisionase family DNA binding protein
MALSEVNLLTVAEDARALRVSRMTVYRLIHAGDLAAVQVGRSYRVPESAVDSYLRAAFVAAG